MQCNCQIFNTTPAAIIAGSIYHFTSDLTSNSSVGTPIAMINPQGPVPAGCTALSTIPGNHSASATFVAQQNSTPADYWAGWVSFAGDPTTYIIDNDVLPFAECNVPGGGSMSFVVFGTGPGNTLQINTYSNPDWTDAAGSCQECLLSPENAAELAFGWPDFIAALLA